MAARRTKISNRMRCPFMEKESTADGRRSTARGGVEGRGSRVDGQKKESRVHGRRSTARWGVADPRSTACRAEAAFGRRRVDGQMGSRGSTLERSEIYS